VTSHGAGIGQTQNQGYGDHQYNIRNDSHSPFRNKGMNDTYDDLRAGQSADTFCDISKGDFSRIDTSNILDKSELNHILGTYASGWTGGAIN
jgi:hypothetical protein